MAKSEQEKFHQALGQAIARWQRVEAGLGNLFEVISTCRNSTVAYAIFYSPRDFGIRLDLIHNAARLWLPDGRLDEWKELRIRLIDESEVRNALAHFTPSLLTGYPATATVSGKPDEGPSESPPHYVYYLAANPFDPNQAFIKGRKRTKKPYLTAHIEEAAKRFTDLAHDLERFLQNIPRWTKRIPIRLRPLPATKQSNPSRKRSPKVRPSRRLPSPG